MVFEGFAGRRGIEVDLVALAGVLDNNYSVLVTREVADWPGVACNTLGIDAILAGLLVAGDVEEELRRRSRTWGVNSCGRGALQTPQTPNSPVITAQARDLNSSAWALDIDTPVSITRRTSRQQQAEHWKLGFQRPYLLRDLLRFRQSPLSVAGSNQTPLTLPASWYA